MSTSGISNPTLSTTTAGHDNTANTTTTHSSNNAIVERASTMSDYTGHGVTTSNASSVPEKQPLKQQQQQQQRVKGTCFQDIIEQDLMTGLEDSTHRLSISDQHPLEKRET